MILFIHLYTAQHVSGTVVPIIRSLSFHCTRNLCSPCDVLDLNKTGSNIEPDITR
jgi:hypothetical protein